MSETPAKKFLYHAHTTALAGTFQRPFNEHMETQASCGLAPTGGVANGRVDKFRHRDFVSCDAAYTTAVGHANDGLHTTLITATVEGLNILNMVTADRIVTRLASRHKLDGSEPSILTVGSHIDNLKIAGRPVEFQYDDDFLAHWDTYALARRGAEGRPPSEVVTGADVIGASIIRDIKAPAGLQVEGNRIYFPEFGSIYLGEIYIWSHRRKLTMMRLRLGCSHEGDVTICDGDGNGSGFPP